MGLEAIYNQGVDIHRNGGRMPLGSGGHRSLLALKREELKRL
jgi:hypothetical protein